MESGWWRAAFALAVVRRIFRKQAGSRQPWITTAVILGLLAQIVLFIAVPYSNIGSYTVLMAPFLLLALGPTLHRGVALGLAVALLASAAVAGRADLQARRAQLERARRVLAAAEQLPPRAELATGSHTPMYRMLTRNLRPRRQFRITYGIGAAREGVPLYYLEDQLHSIMRKTEGTPQQLGARPLRVP